MKILYIAIVCLLFMTSACTRVPENAEEHHEAESHAEEPSRNSVVRMSEKAQKHVGLKTVSASKRQLVEYLQVTGTIQPVDSKVAHVRPVASGRIVEVYVRVGDRVTKGAVLATFDNAEAGEIVSVHQVARAELDKLNIQLASAKQQTERSRRLAEIGAGPRREVELDLAEERALEASIQTHQKVVAGVLAKLRRMGFDEDTAAAVTLSEIRAPFAGVVIKTDVAPGELVRPEDELFQIADPSQVWVQAEVYEKDLGRIQRGQDASIRVDTYPDREFFGKVTYISDVLDPQTRTARVRCEVANADGLLKLDMFATVRLPTTFKKEGIAVPAEAVQQIEGRDAVFVRTGPETFAVRTVQVGKIIQELAEIERGLEGGEAVVTQGAFHLKGIVLGDTIGEEH